MEGEQFKFVSSFLLKLYFFCVFAADFCSPLRSSGLAPNKDHEKRWHLGMARLLECRTRHWRHGDVGARSFCRHGVLGVWPGEVFVVPGWVGLVGREKACEAMCEKENCQATSAWNASCIYLAVRIHRPSALTSSPALVGGVCTYVYVNVGCSIPSMTTALQQLS